MKVNVAERIGKKRTKRLSQIDLSQRRHLAVVSQSVAVVSQSALTKVTRPIKAPSTTTTPRSELAPTMYAHCAQSQLFCSRR